jgi:2,3-bisphosphoglycerate-independent phosphoglycerate mutase
MTKNGVSGLLENKSSFLDSALSTLSLLGYAQLDYPGRGYLEALGIGLNPIPGSIYLRANFSTIKESPKISMNTGEIEKKFVVEDRRCGRDKTGLFEISKDLKGFFFDGVKVEFYKSLGHRGVVVLSSMNLSPEVSDTDPMEDGKEVLQAKPLSNDEKAVKTATALNKFVEESYKILKNHPQNRYRPKPVNYILLRGASTYKSIQSFKDKYNLVGGCIAGSPVIKGLARFLEMDIFEISGATADTKTNLTEKTLRALDLLKRKNFVILHIKGFDEVSHEKNPEFKRLFIEKVDREVFKRIIEYTNFDKTLVAVVSDHATSSKTGKHISGFSPFILFSKGLPTNRVPQFDEISCRFGSVIPIESFMEEILKYT